MSVYRPTPNSDFYVDREFRMDGATVRIKASLWTTTKREGLVREGLLVELHRAGRFDLMRALKAGEITVLDLVAARNERRLYAPDALRDITDRRNLWDVVEACIARGTAGEKTKVRYRLSAKKLKATGALGEEATIRTLHAVNWSTLREHWDGSDSDWNHMRRMLSHALSIYYGDVYAPARRAIVQKIPRAKEPRSRLALLSFDLFRRMVKRTPVAVQPAYWTLLLTAMRAGAGGEYLSCTKEHLDVSDHTVRVPGTKTQGSASVIAVHEDYWYWIERGIPAPRQYKWLRLHWKRAAEKCGQPTIRLHDIRHLSIRLALEGGASLPDVQAHARHEDPKMTMDYARLEQSRRAADAMRKSIVDAPAVSREKEESER